MRIIFIGAVEFSWYALDFLLKEGYHVVGICTSRSSGLNADYVDLSNLSDKYQIPLLNTDDINSPSALDWVKSKSPDIAFCFGWSRLLKKHFLEIPSLGVIGYHPSELPMNRGRHPLIWALVLGIKKTGSTFFFMDEGADSGDILSQREVIILDADDARSLYNKIISIGLDQLREFMPMLIDGTCVRRKQNLSTSNTWRKRGVQDGAIDWRMSATSIHNLVRALTKPYIGAHFIVDGRPIKLWRTEVVKGFAKNIEPGKVVKYMESIPIIKCGEDALKLLETSPKFEPMIGVYI
jgi:methionyl-tRNA formyltransferase